MRLAARDLGVEDSLINTPVGVFFGEPGVRVDDPYFGGIGPARTGCTECVNCMVGCRVGAKNTLVKNYLPLAERLGVRIDPLRTMTPVRPVDAARPDFGFVVTSERTGAWLRRDRQQIRAGQVVVSAGAFNTGRLLHRWRATGDLPELSEAVGRLTRTNSEQLGGASLLEVPEGDLTRGVAITRSFHVDADTHVENCRYRPGSDLMGGLMGPLTTGSGRLKRLGATVAELVRHPVTQAKVQRFGGWSKRTVIALVMQSRDNSLTTSYRRGVFGGHTMTSRQGHGEPNPTSIPQGVAACQALARRLAQVAGGRAMPVGSIGELVDIPMTAHYLGGAVISEDPSGGVVDPYHRVWGYPGITIADGAAVSANLGVNPALTITAQAERVFSLWPLRGESDRRPAQGHTYRRLEPTQDGIAQRVMSPLPAAVPFG